MNASRSDGPFRRIVSNPKLSLLTQSGPAQTLPWTIWSSGTTTSAAAGAAATRAANTPKTAARGRTEGIPRLSAPRPAKVRYQRRLRGGAVRSRRTAAFLPLIVLLRSAAMISCACSSGTSTIEKRSETSIDADRLAADA